VVKLSFRLMVFIGTALAALGAWFLWVWWRRGRLPNSPWFHRALVVSGPLALVALIAGWVTTEVGRQPWVVYEVMRTESAVTGAGGVPVGFAALGLVYLGLVAVTLVMLRRVGRQPLEMGS
jgi:cytochrome d ubiquinol oxidase subunit I